MRAGGPDPGTEKPIDDVPTVDMPTIERLDELVALVEHGRAAGGDRPVCVSRPTGDRPGAHLYVRWSRGPRQDVPESTRGEPASRDTLTGIRLPGLSANPLRVEDWWGARPVRLWVARRLFDYRHLPNAHGREVRPWVLEGDETGRGPDNEPLVRCCRALAWIGEAALRESDRIVAEQGAPGWGPLDRR